MRDNSFVVAVIILALLYLVSPIDLIPDAVRAVDVRPFGWITSIGGEAWGHAS